MVFFSQIKTRFNFYQSSTLLFDTLVVSKAIVGSMSGQTRLVTNNSSAIIEEWKISLCSMLSTSETASLIKKEQH